jgi:hypothetical protein
VRVCSVFERRATLRPGRVSAFKYTYPPTMLADGHIHKERGIGNKTFAEGSKTHVAEPCTRDRCERRSTFGTLVDGSEGYSGLGNQIIFGKHVLVDDTEAKNGKLCRT